MTAVANSARAARPAGAFGMNTGVCDAHNLAWKLAAVLQGQAGPGLLDTYTGVARGAEAARPESRCAPPPLCPGRLAVGGACPQPLHVLVNN